MALKLPTPLYVTTSMALSADTKNSSLAKDVPPGLCAENVMLFFLKSVGFRMTRTPLASFHSVVFSCL
jgi:hypothetical protein